MLLQRLLDNKLKTTTTSITSYLVQFTVNDKIA